MNIITDADFRKSLKDGLDGIYFFYGEEDYLKLHALSSARQSVCPDPSLEFFNDIKIDASEFDPAALANALPTMPVMAEKKLIEMTGLNLLSLKKAESDAFSRCFQRRPTMTQTFLSLWPRPTDLTKDISRDRPRLR